MPILPEFVSIKPYFVCLVLLLIAAQTLSDVYPGDGDKGGKRANRGGGGAGAGPMGRSFTKQNSPIPESLKYIGSFAAKRYYIAVEIQLPWSKAWEFCRAHEMTLVGILSIVEDRYLEKFIRMAGGSEKNWWLSAYNIEENKFNWLSSGKDVRYNNWNETQPDNAAHNEFCVHISGENFPKWFDESCEKAFAFLCQEKVLM